VGHIDGRWEVICRLQHGNARTDFKHSDGDGEEECLLVHVQSLLKF
jgi:hypothetical protein